MKAVLKKIGTVALVVIFFPVVMVSIAFFFIKDTLPILSK